tara:strand:+ start:1279 stop:1902 length:624 start_codon:yes stop_codon:yes gene_type:complete
MIKLYSWSTPNGRKVSILLEELGVNYTVYPINLNKQEQLNESYQKICPTNKIPVIVDTDNNKAIFETGAILLYLSEKYNKFINKKKRWETLSWLMYQMSEIGPMLGQAHQFLYYHPGKSKYSEKKFKDYAKKIYIKVEKQLESRKFLIDDYSIVDIAVWPWIARYHRHQIDILKFPNILQWFKIIASRPAVQKGYNTVGEKEIIPFT